MVAVFNYKTNSGILSITMRDGVKKPKEVDISENDFKTLCKNRDAYGWKKGKAEGEEVVFITPGKALGLIFDFHDANVALQKQLQEA